MKHFYLFLIFLLPLMAGSVRAQSNESARNGGGLGVFGEGLGLHGIDTLTVWGNLVLEQAEVVGEGTLKLRGDRPAQIIAHHSTVQKLHLANATRVTIHGDLRVNKQLTVENGTLDARPGIVTLPGACRVELVSDGKLLVHSKVDIASAKPGSFQTGPQQGDAAMGLGLIWPDKKRSREGTCPVANREPFPAGRYPEEPAPPAGTANRLAHSRQSNQKFNF